MDRSGIFTALIAATFLCAVVISCGGGSTQTCRGKITFEGRTFSDSAGSEERAKWGACKKYCIEGDPAVGTTYKNWAKSQKDPEKRQMSIYDALAAEQTIASAISECEQRCSVDVDGGRLNMEMTCRSR